MNIHQFVQTNALRIADAIMLKKKFFGMLDHYVIYAGVIGGRHHFVANYENGVNYVDERDINYYLEILIPEQIERFPGHELHRQAALQRATNLVGKQEYRLLSSNCEHLKNYVHYGKWESKQVEDFGKGAAAVGIAALVVGLFGLLISGSQDDKA